MPDARRLQTPATALIWVGLALCFLGIAADCVGIDSEAGCGLSRNLPGHIGSESVYHELRSLLVSQRRVAPN